MRMKFIAVVLLAVASLHCASAPPIAAPQWDVVPVGIADAVCQRLQTESFGGDLVLVRITQPIVTSRSLAALFPMQRRPPQLTPPPTRAIPVESFGSTCKWTVIDVAQRDRYHDAIVVEFSAPLINPAEPKAAGLFARTTVGGAHEWYWVSLRPQGDQWTFAGVAPIQP